jgi:small subunit ribosomal protein S1
MVVLSREKAEFKKNWERILTICNEGGVINGKVKAVVKGGLLVNIGVEAFLPASQIDITTPKNLQQYVGNTYDFKVVKINQERQNIVLSRRELIEQERTERRQKLLSEMTPGDIRKGTVKNITDFGAFIDLNGIDGLLHITDMSWGRIGHPSELLKVGQDIDVVVLDINREKERVSLGLKQKMANPWDNIEAKFPSARRSRQGRQPRPLRRLRGTRTGVEGLVHVTELSWTKRIAKPSDVLKPEQESKPSCSASIARNRRSRSASASSKPIRGTRLRRSIRRAPGSKARSATSPATARSSSWKKVSTA